MKAKEARVIDLVGYLLKLSTICIYTLHVMSVCCILQTFKRLVPIKVKDLHHLIFYF